MDYITVELKNKLVIIVKEDTENCTTLMANLKYLSRRPNFDKLKSYLRDRLKGARTKLSYPVINVMDHFGPDKHNMVFSYDHHR